MKKSLLALLAVASLVACNRDDDKSTTQPENVKPQEASIVGVWKLGKEVVYNGKDNSVISEDLPSECEGKSSIEFTKGGKIISRNFTTYNGNCIEDGSENGTYIYNASTKKLKTTTGSETEEIDVISMTADEIQLLERDDLDFNNDGVKDRVVQLLKKVK